MDLAFDSEWNADSKQNKQNLINFWGKIKQDDAVRTYLNLISV